LHLLRTPATGYNWSCSAPSSLDTVVLTLAVVMMSLATAAAYLHSAVQSYLATDTFYVSVPPGIHAPARAVCRRTARRARVLPMHAQHGLPRLPDPLRAVLDVTSLTLGPGEYLPVNNPTEAHAPKFRQAAKACGLQLL
jgi:hypothetical protein